MPPELRKRKAPEQPAEAPAEKKSAAEKKNAPAKKGVVAKAVEKVKKVVGVAPDSGTPKVGQKIELEGFGGEIQTNDGKAVTLQQLVAESKNGVVLFTYPKASTPGCK